MDLNRLAHRIVQQTVDPEAKDTPEQAKQRVSGSQGGKARAQKLSAEERSEIARNAAAARWGKT